LFLFGTPATATALSFLRELCVGSPPPVRELHFDKGGNKMATNNQPATTLRYGRIKATIWQNVSEKGPFFSTPSLARSRIGLERGVTGLRSVSVTLRVLIVAREAKEWMTAHALKH
jgi:hypothetical protein